MRLDVHARAWADAEGYFFPLLSDFWPHGEVARPTASSTRRTGFALRGTFLVDRPACIVWTEVNGSAGARLHGLPGALASCAAERDAVG